LYEKPDSAAVKYNTLKWWCDLTFLVKDTDGVDGYVGRSVTYVLDDVKKFTGDVKIFNDLGGDIPSGVRARTVSAVYVPSQNNFFGNFHNGDDNNVLQFWDDGNKTFPFVGWEVDDAGDDHPNAHTSSYSGAGAFIKISKEEAADILGMDASELTNDKCVELYEPVWNGANIPKGTNDEVSQLKAELQSTYDELRAKIDALGEGN